MPNGSKPFVGGFAPPDVVPDVDSRPSSSSTAIQPRASLGQSNSFPARRAYSTSSADSNLHHQPNGFATPSPAPDQSLPPAPTHEPPVPSHVKRFSRVDAPVPAPPAVVINDSPTVPSPSDLLTSLRSPPVENVPLEQAPPAVQNSLAALKKAEALERRASKRFSTYNISKTTGAANGALTPDDLANRRLSLRATVRTSTAKSKTASEPGKPCPVFLQVGREVKKAVIEPGLSLSSLRMLFVDKFAYSPEQDKFPAIYIRDP
ncbi:hypothetical protein C8Q76DRAFT_796739 [Earliella scabrosa]|nr:hypothetical protein C8Q76DRAFT_796739 [Earliella scabrosa]